MGIFDFVKKVGNKLGIGDEETPPTAEALKKELDSNKLGTDNVDVSVSGDKVVLKVAPPETGLKLDSGIDITELIKKAIPAANPKFYTVKKGDNLSKIAEASYGKGGAKKYKLIFEANKPMLKHPDKIYPGQVLRIPDVSETIAKA